MTTIILEVILSTTFIFLGPVGCGAAGYFNKTRKDKNKKYNTPYTIYRRSNKIHVASILISCFMFSAFGTAMADDGSIQDFKFDIDWWCEIFCLLVYSIVYFNLAYLIHSRKRKTIFEIQSEYFAKVGKDIESTRERKSRMRWQFIENNRIEDYGKRINSKDYDKILRTRARDAVCQSLLTTYSEESEYWIKLLEDTTILFSALYASSKTTRDGRRIYNKAGITVAIINFLKLRTNKSFTSGLFSTYQMILEKALVVDAGTEEIVSEEVYQRYSSVDAEDQAISFQQGVGKAREMLNDYKDLKNSALVTKLSHFFYCTISLSIFDNMKMPFNIENFTVLEREFMKKKFNKNTPYIETFIDTIIFICEKGYQCYVTGTIQPIYHNDSTYAKWVTDAMHIKNTTKYFHTPELYEEDFGEEFIETEFARKINDVIEQGINICSYATQLSKFESDKAKFLLNEIRMIKLDLYSKRACRAGRKAPFSVLVYGESGHAKSTFQDMIYYHSCKLLKLDSDISNRFTINPAAKHMDGITAGVHTILIDDVAAKNPSLGEDATIDYIIQLCNNVPFVAPMAALEDKGKVPFRGKLVIGSTNVKHLNAQYYYSHPTAIQRRFPFIVKPTLKQQYIDNLGRINQAAIPEELPANSYPDLWDIDVFEVKSRSCETLGQTAEHICIASKLSLKEFLKLYNRTLLRHENTQSKVEKHMKTMSEAELCDCGLPALLCDCENQSNILQRLGAYYHIKMRLVASLFIFIYAFTPLRIFCMRYLNSYMMRIMSGEYITFTKYIFSNIGRKVQEKNFRLPKFILGVTTLLTIGAMTSKLYNLHNSYNNANNESDISAGIIPEKEENGRENVWYKNDYELSRCDLSKATDSTQSMSDDDFNSLIGRNCVFLNVSNSEKVCRTKAVCLGGRTYIMNNHAVLPGDNLMIEMITQCRKQGVNENHRFSLSKVCFQRVEDTDLCIVVFPDIPPKRNIFKFLPMEIVQSRLQARYVSTSDEGEFIVNSIPLVNFVPILKVGTHPRQDCYMGTPTSVTQIGDCGSALLAKTAHGHIFYGIHFAKTIKDESVAVAISQKMISPYLQDEYFLVQSSSFEYLSAEGYPRELKSLDKKSVFRYLETGVARVYGSFAGFIPRAISQVCTTPMAHYLRNTYNIKYGAPIMSGWEPKRIAAKEMVRPVTELDENILNIVTEQFEKDIISRLPKGALNMLTPYDIFTNVNGAAGVAYVDKINRNTSAGAPYRKKKKIFMTKIAPKHGMQDPVELDDLILNRMKDMEVKMAKGERSYPVFTAVFKDEAVSFAKIQKKKTRIFTGAPLEFTLLARKYFLSAIRLIQNNRFAFEAGPGTIAQSLEWQEIYNYLIAHGSDRIIAGDYANYDKRMSAQVMLKAFKLLIRLAILSGNFSETDINIMWVIANDTSFPLVDFFGDLVEFYGSNPSGHPLTVIINSLVNSIYMRYAYYMLNPNKECVTFTSNVNLFTYGDDNIMGVSRNISFFNHTSISEYFATLDMTYTMAEKEAQSVPFIHIGEASFLKRTFSYDADIGAIVGKLDHDSIEKMLMVWVKSKTIVWQEQVIAIITSANMEYFWYGKKMYEEKQIMFRNIMKELNIEDWEVESTLPTWTQLNERFWNASKHIVAENQSHIVSIRKGVIIPSDIMNHILSFNRQPLFFHTFIDAINYEVEYIEVVANWYNSFPRENIFNDLIEVRVRREHFRNVIFWNKVRTYCTLFLSTFAISFFITLVSYVNSVWAKVIVYILLFYVALLVMIYLLAGLLARLHRR